MSFADFLRFHWDVRDGQDLNRPQGAAAEGQNNDGQPLGGAGRPAGAGEGLDEEDWEDEENEVDEGEGNDDNNRRNPRDPGGRPQEAGVQQGAAGGVGANPPANQNNDNDADLEQIDVELHVAMDELLGIRGPFPFLLRNILWLIAFNAAYLGLFAFIPYRYRY